MAATTFGAPMDDEVLDPEVAGGAGQQTEAIDPNDPRLTSEVMDDNVSRDAYEVPPPPPDGIWRAKLKHVKMKDPTGKEVDFMPWSHPNVENNKACFVTNVEASLIDLQGTFDNVRVTDGWVKTLIDSKKGTSQVTTIITKAGGTAPTQSTDALRLQTLLKLLASEPEALVETVWEASCVACAEKAKKSGEKRPRAFLLGMHRFPGRLGTHDPVVACPTCHSACRAQVRLNRYYKLGEVKPTRGLANSNPQVGVAK